MSRSPRSGFIARTALFAASVASVALAMSAPAHAADSVPTHNAKTSAVQPAGSLLGTITPFTPTVPNPTTATKAQLDAAAKQKGLALSAPQARSLAAASGVGGSISRAEVLTRAKTWSDVNVPYSQTSYLTSYGNKYRTDCSGFVSMAWNLATSSGNNWGETTGTLMNFTSAIGKDDLKPGDVLLNPAAGDAGHVVIFNGWANDAHTAYDAFEEAGHGTGAVHRTVTSYPYFGKSGYSPRRYNNISDAGGSRDLNGDGMADLAVYEKDGTITMGRGFGDGFTDYHQITTGYGGYDGRLQFADVTGDGIADLLAYEKDGTITMGRGFGNGFTDYHKIASGFGGYDGRLKFADVTGDGKADLVIYEKDGTIKLGRSFGDGFTDYHQITTGFGGYDGRLSFADVTGDGKADLIAYEKDGTITMGRGFGDGFTDYHQITTGFGGYDGRLMFGDVTGDGKADLIAYEKDGTLTLGRGFGDGFTDYHQITTGFGGYDGRLSIVG
ncbi:FG-GAP-like repeat-containing protein [Streptomyces sp. NPDC048361]|uniref:C40 family peptidase n=1 Tax=Streptomyces sp. NPDC048361 TaxID=3154720 RepID=UPI0034283ADF